MIGRFLRRARSRGGAGRDDGRQGEVAGPASRLDAKGWRGSARRVFWVDGVLRIEGWAFLRGGGGEPAVPDRLEAFLRLDTTDWRHPALTLQRLESDEVNEVVDPTRSDLSAAAFRLDIDAERLAAHQPAGRQWAVVLAGLGSGEWHGGPISRRFGGGSARSLWPHAVGVRQLTPIWTPGTGLGMRVTLPDVRLVELTSTEQRLVLDLAVRPSRPVTRVVLEPEEGEPITLAPSGTTRTSARLEIERGSLPPGRYGFRVDHPKGAADPVLLAAPQDVRELERGSADWFLASCDGRGRLVVDTRPVLSVAHGSYVDSTPPTLRLEGVLRGVTPTSGAHPLRLTGPRSQTTAELEIAPDGTATARLPLTYRDLWYGDVDLALPTGEYLLEVDGADRPNLVLGPSLTNQLPIRHLGALMNLRVQREPEGRLKVDVQPPLGRRELGRLNQDRLAARLGSPEGTTRDWVFFETFRGKHAGCNPLAIHEEVARRFPDLEMIWGVRDLSFPVPPGARAAVIGSAEWYAARARARYVVVNGWLHQDFRSNPSQTVLQTWHGTPLKRLATDRASTDRAETNRQARFMAAIGRQSAKWDVLLSQNPHMTDVMSRAYRFEGSILELGYPRNDLVSQPRAAAVRERVRQELGVQPGQTAVLYAPTWRDDTHKKLVRLLDLEGLAAALGEEYVVLVRGHSSTIQADKTVHGRRVVDVTLYPDITPLFVASDALITDYSSVMFDYAVTGKPIVFFVPDLERYRDERRGLYFDLGESGPGPLLSQLDDLVSALRDPERVTEEFRERYAAWRARFVPLDDGDAAARVTDAVFV